MTKEELQDKAYLTATANCMLDCYTYDEFQNIETIPTGCDAWEPFEYWSEKMIYDHVTQIADAIIRDFKEFVT